MRFERITVGPAQMGSDEAVVGDAPRFDAARPPLLELGVELRGLDLERGLFHTYSRPGLRVSDRGVLRIRGSVRPTAVGRDDDFRQILQSADR